MLIQALTNQVWQAFRQKATQSPDGGNPAAPVTDLYGNVKMFPGSPEMLGADEGSEYSAANVTPLTGITGTGSLTTDAAANLAPFLVLQNQSSGIPGQGAIRAYLRYIRIIQTATVPTSATNWRFTAWVDNVSGKVTTAGTTLTSYQVNGDASGSSKCLVQAGAIVTTAPGTNGRRVLNASARTVIPVSGDEWLIEFGNPSPSTGILNGTNPTNFRMRAPATVIGPGQNFSFAMFGASAGATAPVCEVEVVWCER